MVTMVGQIECTDSGRWPVRREFNRRMKIRFQQLGVDIAFPAQTRSSATTIPRGSDAPARATPPSEGADSGTRAKRMERRQPINLYDLANHPFLDARRRHQCIEASQSGCLASRQPGMVSIRNFH
jgi:hypothetical protein